METSEILLELRNRAGLSQDELAAKVYVTRQAVSRWENGETTPNTETLKRLSEIFGVSINTLLGSPRRLVCQCCGMPLEEGVMSRERDGAINAAYCKWCYTDGRFMYESMDALVDFLVPHLASEQFPPQQVRASVREMLPRLDFWKRYEALGGEAQLAAFKEKCIAECSALRIEGMPEIDALHPMVGRAMNFAFELPNGKKVRFLEDDAIYLGNRLPCLFDEQTDFGIVVGPDFLLICTVGSGGEAPELRVYQRR